MKIEEQDDKPTSASKGLAIAGLVLGIIALTLSVVAIIFSAIGMAQSRSKSSRS
jgi:hypothetical protein